MAAVEINCWGAAQMEITLRNLLFVTYILPIEMIRPLVPQRLQLDCISGADGQEFGLVSTVVLSVRKIAYRPWFSADVYVPMMNYRTYLSDPPGSLFFFSIGMGSRTASTLAFPVVGDLCRIVAELRVMGDPAAGRYDSYEVESFSPEGKTHIHVRSVSELGAPPTGFLSWEDAVGFITDRPRGVFRTRPGLLGSLRADHVPFEPYAGEVIRAVFPVWERIGLRGLDERHHLHSVLIQPEAVFQSRLPGIEGLRRPRRRAGGFAESGSA